MASKIGMATRNITGVMMNVRIKIQAMIVLPIGAAPPIEAAGCYDPYKATGMPGAHGRASRRNLLIFQQLGALPLVVEYLWPQSAAALTVSVCGRRKPLRPPSTAAPLTEGFRTHGSPRNLWSAFPVNSCVP